MTQEAAEKPGKKYIPIKENELVVENKKLSHKEAPKHPNQRGFQVYFTIPLNIIQPHSYSDYSRDQKRVKAVQLFL